VINKKMDHLNQLDLMDRVFQLSPIPTLILDPSLCALKASKSFLKTAALDSAQCVGTHCLTLLEATTFAPDAGVVLIREALEKSIHTKEVQVREHVPAGLHTHAQIRVVPICEDGALVYLVLEWHSVQVIPPESIVLDMALPTNEVFRILVETVKDYAIFLLDTKGHVVTWNAGAMLNKRYTRKEILGKHFSVFYSTEDRHAKKPEIELEVCLRDGRVEDEGWRYRKDGSRFWANVIITAVYNNGVHVGFGKVTRDLTERRSAETRLISAYEQSAKLKSEFLANMSHEIRTPMHGMVSACTLILDTALTDEQRELAVIIDDSGKIMLQVINDILDYSKIVSGSFSISPGIVDVAGILGSVIRGFQSTLKPGVRFESLLAPNLPISAQGDPLRYRQVAQNLISNATKFTADGFVRVQSSVVEEDDDHYFILTEITDTGIGVPDSATNELFTPFTQFDLTATKRFGGTGLGLSIAKSLANLMGGQTGFRHNPDQHGSIFWFTAKLKKFKTVENLELSAQLAATKLSPAGENAVTVLKTIASTKTLLLAEDNLINQRVIIKMLGSLGFRRIHAVSDGVEATRLVLQDPQAFDLILMDINMPLLDGLGATVAIRDEKIMLPIIAMTANALKGDRENCLEKGMNDYVSKPVQRELLISVLTKWLTSGSDSGAC
jgi:osomolarity two-component system sensor histidine kinase TcsA